MSVFKRPTGKTGSGGDFELPSEEPQPAVLIGIIDIGTQTSPKYGKSRQGVFIWELTGEERKKDNTPFILAHKFTLSMNEKSNLYKFVKAWRKNVTDGEEYDVAGLLGMKAVLNIELKGGQGEKGDRTYLEILGANKPAKGQTVNDPENDPLLWEIEGGSELPEQKWIPNLYGKPIQEMIRESDEWRAREAQRAGAEKTKAVEKEADAAFSRAAPAPEPEPEEEPPVRAGKRQTTAAAVEDEIPY
jgi:hypothetical protein